MSAPLAVDPPAAVAALIDADRAAVSSDARQARAEVTVIRSTGNLVRTSDLGHSPQYLGNPLPMNVKVAGATCSVCGEEWPCASRRWEVGAGRAVRPVEVRARLRAHEPPRLCGGGGMSAHLSPTPTPALADLWRALTHPYTPRHKKENRR